MKLFGCVLAAACLFQFPFSQRAMGYAVGSPVYFFKEPAPRAYQTINGFTPASFPDAQWIPAQPLNQVVGPYQLGSKIVLQVADGTDMNRLLAGTGLTVVENAAPNVYVLQAGNAWEAAATAEQLAERADVVIAQPDMQRPVKLDYTYAPAPDDPYFDMQWHLENRSGTGARQGVDINARSAWPWAKGSGVNMAVVDVGVQMIHPDLNVAASGMPHYNFLFDFAGGTAPPGAYHGTAVSGLALARGDNQIGVTGVAPQARLASWVVFGDDGSVASGTQFKQMFQAYSNIIDIQNHSWSFSTFQQLGPQPIEYIGISNAITLGRDGKGIVMVRSAGNNRLDLVSANDDGYVNDPRIIAVGAVRKDGQNTSYSNPGACLLVAAPSGDQDQGFPKLLTTDLLGSSGLNTAPGSSDFSNYGYFSGTSASSPIVAGIAALLLEINPDFTYRDVQQIILMSARQHDLADPIMTTNSAGFLVSNNTGFGVPDAGRAVRLAQNWPLRPPLTTVVYTSDQTNQISNLGLRIETSGHDIPLKIASIPATPSLGLHPEDLTPFRPLADVGMATNTITEDLSGKVALIQRGGNTFSEKVQYAAQAGAELAIIANYPNDEGRLLMGGTYRTPIPAVFIAGSDGVALRNFLTTNGTAQVRSILFAAQITNHVDVPMLVEHVQVNLRTEHPRRGDVRVTVTSPSGTRSVLQSVNGDFTAGPIDWTYMSTHHFYESAQGIWSIQISDEDTPAFGNQHHAELILHGVMITDTDKDGLDDNWEQLHFGHLAAKPNEDADGDGDNNMREYIQGTDPLGGSGSFAVNMDEWNPGYWRLSWPSLANAGYEVLGTGDVAQPMQVLTNLAGAYDSQEWIVPSTNQPARFFQVRRQGGAVILNGPAAPPPVVPEPCHGNCD